MGNFYDNNKLLNLLDENGNHPEIFISEGNRSAGKTISFNRYLVNNYIKKVISLYYYIDMGMKWMVFQINFSTI